MARKLAGVGYAGLSTLM